MGTMFKTKKPIAISTTLQKVFRNEGVSGEFAKFSKALKTKKEQSAQKLNAPTNAEEDGVLLGGNTKLIVEGVMPDLLHVIPVGNDSVLNGVLQGEDSSLGLGLVSDIGVL